MHELSAAAVVVWAKLFFLLWTCLCWLPHVAIFPKCEKSRWKQRVITSLMQLTKGWQDLYMVQQTAQSLIEWKTLAGFQGQLFQLSLTPPSLYVPNPHPHPTISRMPFSPTTPLSSLHVWWMPVCIACWGQGNVYDVIHHICGIVELSGGGKRHEEGGTEICFKSADGRWPNRWDWKWLTSSDSGVDDMQWR